MSEEASTDTLPQTPASRFVVATIRGEGVVLYREFGGTETTNSRDVSASRFEEVLQGHVSRYERAWQTLANS